jgi:hypothetical protein
MEEITKEWPAKFLIPFEQTELSDPDLIKSPVVTHEEYDALNNNRKKNKKEVQELRNALKETTPNSPQGGGGDEVEREEDEGGEDK